MVWYSHLFQNFLQFVVKGFNVVSEAEVDVFLEFFYFFYAPTDVGNLISSSSSLSAIWVVSHVYLRLFTFLPEILILAGASASLEFHIMYCVYKLKSMVTIYSLDTLLS